MTITWVEGHAQKNGASVFISVPHITVVTPLEKFVRIYTDDGDYTDISDDYEEVKEAIIKMSDVADIITEADLRPDTTDPLTWKELTSVDMIGQPVWNSNTLKWMLVIDSDNLKAWVDLANHSGGTERWIEHDAQKYPLYRMAKP